MTAEGQRFVGQHPVTPDGRYFVVRGHLWRMANPTLDAARLHPLVTALMGARRAITGVRRKNDGTAETAARQKVDAAKVALGERGPPWWTDGSPDLNRHLAHNTLYADWFAALDVKDS